MLTFNSKKEIFNYIKRKFSKTNKLILVRGSAAKKALKKFSDIDVEVYGNSLKKPYYEIIFLKEKPVLISAYFYKYKEGHKTKIPKEVKILYGRYNNKIKPDFSKDVYTNQQKIKRECQMVVDTLFKYLRHNKKEDLEHIQKRI